MKFRNVKRVMEEPQGINKEIVKTATDCVMDALNVLPEKDRVFLALCLCTIIDTQIDVDSMYIDNDGIIHTKAIRAVNMN